MGVYSGNKITHQAALLMAGFNFCPHCKSENFTFKDFHKFECKDCGFVFYENIAAAVGVIIEYKGKILFTIRNKPPHQGGLDLPGGFTDPGETAEETCARELKEELNLKLSLEAFSYFTSQPNLYEYKGFPYKTEDLVFIVQLKKAPNFQLQKEEIKTIKWVEKSKIKLEEIVFPSLRKAVEHYLKR